MFVEVQNVMRSIQLKFVKRIFRVQSNIIQLKLGLVTWSLYKSYIKLIPEVWLAELSISDLELENSERSSENSDLLSL
jgi:hypothetical protein